MCSVAAGLLLAASPLAIWIHDRGETAAAGLGHLSPGGPLAWALAAGVVAVAGFGFASALFRARSARRRAALPRWAAYEVIRHSGFGVEVRVANSPEMIAFAVPGEKHIVVSRGLAECLPANALNVVLAHEEAHLRLRHDRHLLVLATYQRVLGWLPGAARAVRDHRDAIECWADAHASFEHSLPATAVARARSLTCRGPVCSVCSRHGAGRATLPAVVGWAGLGLLATASCYVALHAAGDLLTAVSVAH